MTYKIFFHHTNHLGTVCDSINYLIKDLISECGTPYSGRHTPRVGSGSGPASVNIAASAALEPAPSEIFDSRPWEAVSIM